MIFSIIYGIILPIDELMFFKMVKTTNQLKKVFLGGHINQQPLGDIVINNYIVYGYISGTMALVDGFL